MPDWLSACRDGAGGRMAAIARRSRTSNRRSRFGSSGGARLTCGRRGRVSSDRDLYRVVGVPSVGVGNWPLVPDSGADFATAWFWAVLATPTALAARRALCAPALVVIRALRALAATLVAGFAARLLRSRA